MTHKEILESLPDSIKQTTNMTSKRLEVFAVIYYFHSINKPCFLGNEQFMLRTGIKSKSTLSEAFQFLEKLGLIKRLKTLRYKTQRVIKLTKYALMCFDPRAKVLNNNKNNNRNFNMQNQEPIVQKLALSDLKAYLIAPFKDFHIADYITYMSKKGVEITLTNWEAFQEGLMKVVTDTGYTIAIVLEGFFNTMCKYLIPDRLTARLKVLSDAVKATYKKANNYVNGANNVSVEEKKRLDEAAITREKEEKKEQEEWNVQSSIIMAKATQMAVEEAPCNPEVRKKYMAEMKIDLNKAKYAKLPYNKNASYA